jgi:hypothetical protein
MLRTMLALRDLDVPSFSVQDSIIVQRDREMLAGETLSNLYKATTGAAPRIATTVADTLVAGDPLMLSRALTVRLQQSATVLF